MLRGLRLLLTHSARISYSYRHPEESRPFCRQIHFISAVSSSAVGCIHPLFQAFRAPECDDSAGIQDQGITGLWVSAPPVFFILHLKFAEAGDRYGFTGFEGEFHEFQDGFEQVAGGFFGKAVAGRDLIDEVVFTQGHERFT
jgi:hypothetical protein